MAVKVKQHKGKWWVFIDHKGKRKAKCVGSKQAAEMAAKKIEAKLTLGDFSLLDDKPQRPFDVYFRNWLDTYVKAHCKVRTYELYADVFRLHLRPHFIQKDIANITREDVKQIAYRLLTQGKSRGTVKSVLTPLSAMFTQAVEDQHVTFNPAVRILKRSRSEEGEQQQKISFLTREEVAVLLNTCSEHFPVHSPLILLLVRTGMRIGEALALQWGDLDFQGRFAEVRRTLRKGRLSTPKSNKSRRVDLSQQLTETLKSLLVERKKETLKRGWGEVPPWVFINQAPVPIQHSHLLGRVWPKLLGKAGLRRIRIHDLRHTYASLLIQNGESLAYVKEQLGHHSIQMTVDTYGHLVPGGNKAAVDRLDTLEPTTVRNLSATTPTDVVLPVSATKRNR
jgi:integrase